MTRLGQAAGLGDPDRLRDTALDDAAALGDLERRSVTNGLGDPARLGV